MAYDQPNHLTNNPPGTVPVDADKLEANFNYIIGLLNAGLPASALATAVSQALPPPGALMVIAYDSADPGWLLCDGTAVSRSTYAALFAKVGTKYGTGDGSTTFNLPDLRGRAPIGKGTHADVDTLGKSEGVAIGSRTPKAMNGHTHTHDHIHNVAAIMSVAASGDFSQVNVFSGGSWNFVSNQTHTHSTGFNVSSGNSFGNTTSAPSTANTDGFVVVNHQIKT